MSDTAAPRIIRKKTGNFLEDFQPGQIFRHKGGKTVTEGLFTTFTEFSMTTHPLAKNARYARAYGFEGLVCPPGLVMLIAFSQTVEDVSENARANLEYIDMRFGAPVYVGDTLEVETKVLGLRVSSSRPNLGIVHVQSTARKNIGEPSEAIVATWQRKVQVYKGDESAKIENFEVPADEIECELWMPAYRADAKLDEARPSLEQRQLLRGPRARYPDRAFARSDSDRRTHLDDRSARQHEPGPLQPVHDRPRPEAIRRGSVDRLRRHSLHPLSRPLLPGCRRQQRWET